MREARRRAGRPAAGQGVLTVDRILAAALELVDEHGLDALSMRRLARRLDVDPMSIYHHLPNKAAVISGLVELVFSQMQPPETGDDDWAEQVRAWVHAYHDLTRAHPHLVLQIVTDPAAVSRAAQLINEPLHTALTRAGLPSAKIAGCAGMFVDYVNGFALAEVGPPPAAGQSAAPAGFDTGLDIMLLGVRALAAKTTQTGRPTGPVRQQPD